MLVCLTVSIYVQSEKVTSKMKASVFRIFKKKKS